MNRLMLHAPSRLHFGLLAWGPATPRQFGGVGLMVRDPGLTLAATPSDRWSAAGHSAGRVREVLDRVVARVEAEGHVIPPARIDVTRAPAEHVGLGLGTQLGLGVARLVDRLAGLPDRSPEALARQAGRGLRSGVGLHGFHHGGLIVDGGRSTSEDHPDQSIPPLLARSPFPPEWSVLVVVPGRTPGLHGEPERRAFAALPPFPDALTDRLCRLVLLGLLPAVAERDLPAFGDALEEMQRRVGEGFAPAQGGVFGSAETPALLAALSDSGLHGVGQSSWGPTLYGLTAEPDPDRRAAILAGLRDRFGLAAGEAFWTGADPIGVRVEAG